MVARALVLVALALTAPRLALAQPAPAPEVVPSDATELAPEAAIRQRLGVWRVDALGMEPALVAQLEALFRSELDRLAVVPIPSRRDTEKAAGRGLRDCTGEDKCLAAIGKKLGVEVMVAGSVAALGDSYILDIKAVEVAGARPLRRIATDPLRGEPDELIEAIRVAAYRLLAPDELHGSITVLSDLVGAAVSLDGKVVGTTPLPRPLARLPLGKHRLRLEAKGYDAFEDEVEVRFQKATRVVVNLIAAAPVDVAPTPVIVERERPAWYRRWYVIAGIGVAAVLTGALIGGAIGGTDPIDCPGGASC